MNSTLTFFLHALSILAKLIGAFSAIWSARYWIESADARVMPVTDGSRTVVITEDDESDVLLTLKEQSRLNAIAARWAAGAAIAAATLTLLSFGGY